MWQLTCTFTTNWAARTLSTVMWSTHLPHHFHWQVGPKSRTVWWNCQPKMTCYRTPTTATSSWSPPWSTSPVRHESFLGWRWCIAACFYPFNFVILRHPMWISWSPIKWIWPQMFRIEWCSTHAAMASAEYVNAFDVHFDSLNCLSPQISIGCAADTRVWAICWVAQRGDWQRAETIKIGKITAHPFHQVNQSEKCDSTPI